MQAQLDRDHRKYDAIRAINESHASDAKTQLPTQSPIHSSHPGAPKSTSEKDDTETYGTTGPDSEARGPEEQIPSPSSKQEELEREDLEKQDTEDPVRVSGSSGEEEVAEWPVDEQAAPLGISLSRTTTRSARSLGTRIGRSLTGVNVRDRTSKEGGDSGRQVFVVGFEGEADPMNPHNWSRARRIMSTIFVAFIGAVVGLASSIDSSVLRPAASAFGVSEVTESLATGKQPISIDQCHADTERSILGWIRGWSAFCKSYALMPRRTPSDVDL